MSPHFYRFEDCQSHHLQAALEEFRHLRVGTRIRNCIGHHVVRVEVV